MKLNDSLAAIESLLDQVSEAMLSGDARALESGSIALRDAAAALTYALDNAGAQGGLDAASRTRIQTIGARLSVHRESLARLSSSNDRQLAGLLPPSDAAAAATYGDPLAQRKGQAGVPRIYRSAG